MTRLARSAGESVWRSACGFGAAVFGCAIMPVAARAGPPFVVDDPGTVEAGKGTLLMGWDYARLSGVEQQGVPSAMLNLGLTEGLELGIGEQVVSLGGQARRSVKLDDLEITPKWRFLDQDDSVPSIAVAYTLRVPTGLDSVGGETVVHSPYGMLGWQLDEQWQIFGQVGARVPQHGPERVQCEYGLAVGYQATENVMVGADVFGTTRVSDGQAAGLNVGLAAQIDLSEMWTIMLHVGHSVAGPPQMTFFVGLQLNF